MAGLKTTITLQDRMSGVLRNISKTTTKTIDNMKAAGAAADNAFNPNRPNRMKTAIERMKDSISDAIDKQERFNDEMKNGTSAADGLAGKVKGIAAAVASIQTIRKVADFVSGSIDLYNVQNKAETQLKNVLKNVNAVDGAFEKLRKTASKLQSTTMFGDEALLGGAAELATYMSDTKAIQRMMKTLTNYAAGMSGGSEVGYEEMVNYATNLGKIMTGSFDAMTKKGFEFTEAQKEIIKNGTDMQKALVIDEVISESWDGLAKQMANTPSGKIAQIKNAFGDIREELAVKVLPTIMKLYDAISQNMPQIKTLIMSLSVPVNAVVGAITKILEAASAVYNFFAENWEKIAPIILAILPPLVTYELLLHANSVAHIGAAVATKVHALAQRALGIAIAFANSKLLIAMSIIGVLIGAFVALCLHLGKTRSEATTTFGKFTAGIAVVGAWFKNVFGIMVPALFKAVLAAATTVAHNLNIAFHNSIEKVKGHFYDMLSVALSVISKIAEQLSKLPFVNFDASGISSAAGKYAQKAAEAYGNIKEYGSVKDAFSKAYDAAGGNTAFAEGWAEDAAKKGAEWGDSKWSALKEKLGLTTSIADAGASGETLNNIADDTSSIAKNLSATNEELSWLRDIAEREAINRFTTAEIKIDMTGMTNEIHRDVDVDGMYNKFVGDVGIALQTAAAGVY